MARFRPTSISISPIRISHATRSGYGALERSLTEIVRRHEILRTSYPLRDGSSVQRIHAPGEIRLAQVDLSGLDAPG